MSALNIERTPAQGRTQRPSLAKSRSVGAPLLLLTLVLAAPLALPSHAQERSADRKTNEQAAVKSEEGDASTQTGGGTTGGARPAQRAAAATGSITGRVVNEAGEPLAGVTVRVGGRNTGAINRPAPAASTDEEGLFLLRDLGPNVYNVWADLPGYVTEPEPPSSPVLRGRVRVGDNVTIRMTKGGVITGTVTDATGDPLIGTSVRVLRIREGDGRGQPVGAFGTREGMTDDRGVYRIYGLQAGVYIVSAGGAAMWSWWPVPRSDSPPTFYPSGTRDTAAEILLREGQEVSGVDIRFREGRGLRVTGTVVTSATQPGEENINVSVYLVHAASGTFVASAYIQGRESERGFSFEGLADGDYDLHAQENTRAGLSSKSPALRVTLKGADVTGLKLTPVPLASVSGTLAIEPLGEAERARGECKDQRARLLPQEVSVFARLEPRPVAKNQPRQRAFGSETVADDTGAFTVRGLEAGRYRVEVRPVDEHFYARTVTLPDSAASGPAAARPAPARTTSPAADAPLEAVELRPGQQLSGIQIRVAEGAAYLAGQFVPAEEGATTPAQTRLYLLPAEREQADNLRRFYEAAPAPDGAFIFRNLAPGRYLLLARPFNFDPTDPVTMRPAHWDTAERARMRREAEAAATTIELQPCQRISDYTLRHPR